MSALVITHMCVIVPLVALMNFRSFVWFSRLKLQLNKIRSNTSGMRSTRSWVTWRINKLKTYLVCIIFLQLTITLITSSSLMIMANMLTQSNSWQNMSTHKNQAKTLSTDSLKLYKNRFLNTENQN